MVTSFTNTIVAPGTVLKRDNQPVVINDDDNESAILPIDNIVPMETDYEFSQCSQSLLLNEVLKRVWLVCVTTVVSFLSFEH